MSKAIDWLTENDLCAINAALVAAYGGLGAAVRDPNLLSASVARPKHQDHYTGASIFDLAASLAFAIVHNHPFIDGNKRTAAVAMGTFLELNGWVLTLQEPDLVVLMLSFATNAISTEELSKWLQTYCLPSRP